MAGFQRPIKVFTVPIKLFTVYNMSLLLTHIEMTIKPRFEAQDAKIIKNKT